MTESSENTAAYERGVGAGRIEQRLQGHDEHLRHINGSIDSMTRAMQALTEELRANAAILGANVASGAGTPRSGTR
ncbi:hypothetical protein OOJ91_00655 [Micromonospora lupini]|uniref:hypothetical protein n=1 Tax=Micromonospora lupini TaxID=285679 RepID=UPI00225ABCC9|nr:hypothetical protein [Micromonospora lupini]MCX5064372.1 hypothetical protein [Micromonospora lupini]